MAHDPAHSILHVFSSFAVGGPQVRFAGLANHLGAGYRHAIVSMDGDYACRSRIDPCLEVSYPDVIVRKGATIANVIRFRRLLRDLRPGVMVTSNWGAIEWSLANVTGAVRHIHIEDGFGPEECEGQIPRRVLFRRACLRRSTVVVPSRTLWRIAVDRWRLPVHRVRHIPNGIDLTRFGNPRDDRDQARWPGAGPVIGTVAALRPEKNLSRLLHAFALVAKRQAVRLVMVGDGPERNSLERLAREMGVAGSVHFTGYVADPAPIYRSFDLFALSSDTEQMPLSLTEAMAAGLPVAATRVGDVAEMVATENQPFVVARQAEALAGALQQLAAEPALRRRLGTANRQAALRRFDQEEMFRAYRRLLSPISLSLADVAA